MFVNITVLGLFVSPKIHVLESLTPNVTMSGGEVFGRWLHHEGISDLRKEIPQSSLASSAKCADIREVCDLEEGSYLTILAPWPWTYSFQNCEKQISVVYKLPSLWYFVVAAQTD